MKKDHNYTLGNKWQTGVLSTTKKTTIRWALYRKNSITSPKKFILFLNGRTEYIEKYHYIAEDLNLSPDVGFLTFDHQGQGCSSGKLSHIDSYDHYQFDCHCLLKKLVQDKPYLIMAHSMGALITVNGLISGLFKPQKVFLLSPFFGISKKRNILPFTLVKYLTYILKNIGLSQTFWKKTTTDTSFKHNLLTSCPEQYERMLHSPYNWKEPTVGWINASYQALDNIHQQKLLATIACPIDILIAKKDQLVNNDDTLYWAMKAQKYSSIPSISIHFLKGQHELLSERKDIYQPAIQKLQSWLQSWNNAQSLN